MGRYIFPLKGFDYGYATQSNRIGKSFDHYHDSYELLFMVHGKSDYFIKDVTYAIEDNYIVLVPPNVLHRNTYKSSKIERHILNFTEELIPVEFREGVHSLFEKQLYIPHNPNMLSSFMKDILTEYGSDDVYTGTIVHGFLNRVLAYLLRNPSMPIPDKANISHPAVIKITRYINENFEKPLTINEAAERMGMNRSYLSRIFNQSTGYTFKNYLLVIRLKEAKRLLECTDKSIAEIACMCGFSDGNYFSAAFKKAEKIPPLEYRKAIRNGQRRR